jgi:hypothetical protein
VVARLRKDAALCDLPAVPPPGQIRGQGHPPIYGKDRLSLAKRAGQARGWRELTVETTTGGSVTKTQFGGVLDEQSSGRSGLWVLVAWVELYSARLNLAQVAGACTWP